MTKLTQDQLYHLRHDYWCYIAANYQDNHAPRIVTDDAPTFYEWLLMYGFNRHQLSAAGVTKTTCA